MEERQDSPAVTTRELPLTHGYFREHLFMGAREKADIRAQMQRTADRLGYRLGKVFEEKVETTPEAFRTLVNAAVSDGAAVMVPGINHLAVHGHATTIRDCLAKAIGQPVFIADPY